MKLNEVALPAMSLVDAIKKAFDTAAGSNGARLESIVDFGMGTIAFEVEFDFPEGLVKATEIKKAGAPHIAKVDVTKGDMWKEGVFGALYEITLKTPIETAEAKKLLAELKKIYKVK